MKPLPTLLLTLALSLPAAAAAPSAAESEAQLKQADTAFCALAAKSGIAAAFAAYAAPDCTFPDTQPEKLHGQDAVKERLTGTPDGMTLTWSPTFASASASGDLGYTWGRYEAKIPTANGTVTRTGHYTTIWRRQPNGDWKYVLDTGNPDAPKK